MLIQTYCLHGREEWQDKDGQSWRKSRLLSMGHSLVHQPKAVGKGCGQEVRLTVCVSVHMLSV